MSCRVEVIQGKRCQDWDRSIRFSRRNRVPNARSCILVNIHNLHIFSPTLWPLYSVARCQHSGVSCQNHTYISNHFLHVRVCHFFHLKRCPVPGFPSFVCLFPATSCCASTSFFPLHHPMPVRRPVPGCPSCMSFTAKYGIPCTATYCT